MNIALTAVDVAIGLSFVYLLMALMCSVFQEIIANVTSWRGRSLRSGIQSMLNDPTMAGLAREIYAHPRISALSLPGQLPSYIPGATFGKALAEILDDKNMLNMRPEGPLAPFLKAAAGNAEKLEADLTSWFDQSMDRVGGWYKRWVQLVILAIGFVLAVSLNVDSLKIARALWTQPILRDVVSQSASKFYVENKPTVPDQQQKPPAAPGANQNAAAPPVQDITFQKLQQTLDGMDLPIGWTQATWTEATKLWTPGEGRKQAIFFWASMVAGWILTALASSLGTQFWFQTLGEALSLRAAGKKPEPAKDSDNPSNPAKPGG